MSNASAGYVEERDWQQAAMFVTAFGLVAGYVAIGQLIWGAEVGELVPEALVSLLPAFGCFLIGDRAREAERARQRGRRYVTPWYRWSRRWYGAYAVGTFLMMALFQFNESWLGMAALAPLFGIASYRWYSVCTRTGHRAERVVVPVEQRARLWNESVSETCHVTS